MKQILLLLSGIIGIVACSDVEVTSTKEPSKSTNVSDSPKGNKSNSTEKTPENTLTDSEMVMLEPYLTDIRTGIREFAPNTIGICAGESKECGSFLGLDAGELTEGQYVIRGEFQAPKIEPEGGWKVTFAVDCTIVKETKDGTTTTSKQYSKDYSINHVSRTEYGYRLSPLYRLSSPSSRGTETCSWSITGNNLSEPVVWKGSYTIPYKG
jgi:hypothetical protein